MHASQSLSVLRYSRVWIVAMRCGRNSAIASEFRNSLVSIGEHLIEPVVDL